MTRNRSIILLLLIACVVVPSGWLIFGEGGGCSWFRQQTAEEREKSDAEKRKEEEEGKEKEKPDFEPMKITILPGMMASETEDDETDTVDGTEEINGLDTIEGNEPQGLRQVAAKPGHWVYARYESTANNYDFSGQLTVECTDSSLNPIDLERSPYRSNASRPVVFPKGQTKAAELPVFVSVPTSRAKKTVQLHAMLRPKGGRSVSQDYTPILRLKPHQYHIVVLAGDPDRYGYVRSLDTVSPPAGDDWATEGLREDYIVTLHGVGENESMLLPGNPLAWTSIAYLIWDDVPPDSLAPDQQLALIDWLHWGGQLILSGPQTLDQLRASFLAEFLPATSDRSEVATAEMLKPLNNEWSLRPQATELDLAMYRLSSTEKRPLDITPLEPTEGSQAVPGTGGLVVERQVGRGRITVTAFSLSNRNVVNWQNFDGFFNGCLLRRPAREFRLSNEGFSTVTMPDMPLRRHDARINCGLRYFSRDATIPGEGRASARASLERDPQQAGRPPNVRRLPDAVQDVVTTVTEAQSIERTANAESRGLLWGFGWQPKSKLVGDRGLLGYQNDKVAGVAGWGDFSAAGVAARRSLQEAAGISVPEAGFVAKVLAGYLLCLVPVNWLLFKLLRRVEWAWFAAPVIAIAGAVGVVKLAQLDIGFVRSRTEIAVLETQPGYSRGHLTRYTGMYTSLTSDYALTFDDSNAVGLPFSTNPSTRQLQLQKQKGKAVPFVRDTKVALSGYPVLSNSTGMVHVEQMVELPGQLELIPAEDGETTPKVRNGMEWDVRCAIAIHIHEDGFVRMFPLGDLAAGAEVRLPSRGGLDAQPLLDQLSASPTTTAVVQQGEVSLREMLRLAVHPSSARPGGWRVVGWTDQPVPGMEIEPKANQNLFRTVMICHLDHGPLPEAAVDENHAVDFQPEVDPFDLEGEDENDNE